MKKYLVINMRDEMLRIDLDNLVYIQADGNYVQIVTANKLKSVLCMTLGKTQEMLTASLGENASMLARVGKKHIINLRFVHSIQPIKQKLVLSDDATFAFQLDVAKQPLRALKQALSSHATGSAATNHS